MNRLRVVLTLFHILILASITFAGSATYYLAKPEPPKLVAVIPVMQSVRVVFEKKEFSTEYALTYTVSGETKTTAPTHHGIGLTSLTSDVSCEISVAAMNGAGEGKPSRPITVFPKYGNKSLPPVVWLTEACNIGSTIGQSWVFPVKFYEVQYTARPNDSALWKIITSVVFGTFRVSALENAQKYYLQMRSIPQGGGIPGEWSEILTAGNLAEELINQSEIEYVLLQKVGNTRVKNIKIKAF